MIENLIDDIPADLASRAYGLTSHSPSQLGKLARDDYARILTADHEELLAAAVKHGADLSPHFSTYRAKCAELYRAALSAQSREASPGIIGPANFPSRRMEKIRRGISKRWAGFSDFRERAKNAIRRDLAGYVKPVSDPSTVTRVTGPLATIEDDPSVNRVRLIYSGKPDATVRSALKGQGFRWSPTNTAWQAIRSHAALEKAKHFAGLIETSIEQPKDTPSPTFNRYSDMTLGQLIGLLPERARP